MSHSAKRKKQLLKLSKAQLIKTCKQFKLPTTGSKGDMINRIIKHEIKLNPDIDQQPNLKPKKKRKSSRKSKKPNDAILSRNALHFVLDGYIRSIENSLPRNQIIPKEILILCSHYLLPNNIFISLIRINSGTGYI